jgi:hypothetical protein
MCGDIHSLTCQGEKLDELYATIVEALTTQGPVAVVIKRKMAPGGKLFSLPESRTK